MIYLFPPIPPGNDGSFSSPCLSADTELRFKREYKLVFKKAQS